MDPAAGQLPHHVTDILRRVQLSAVAIAALPLATVSSSSHAIPIQNAHTERTNRDEAPGTRWLTTSPHEPGMYNPRLRPSSVSTAKGASAATDAGLCQRVGVLTGSDCPCSCKKITLVFLT